MSGRVEYDESSGNLRITFPYHPRLVDVVRGFEGRRFDRSEKAWYVPSLEIGTVVDSLREQRFTFDEHVVRLYREAGGGELEAGATAKVSPDPTGSSVISTSPKSNEDASDFASSFFGASLGANSEDPESLRVSEVNQLARASLRRQFPKSIWVVGEITGFDRWKHKKHAYFQLVEKPEGDQDLAASVTAVLFEGVRPKIEERLAKADPPMTLQDGIAVRFLARVDLFARTGSFQLILEDVDPTHTLGQLALKRERILRDLQGRGLMEKNRRLPWPLLPLRIGLITSLGSDAYNDFLNELQRSKYGFQIIAYGAVMQGATLEASVLKALDYFEGHGVDVLVITRGGGSKTDLAWFDNLEVALRVAQSPIKILAGIGHHRDVSVIDLIAESAKTPTAVAGLIIDRVRASDEALEGARRRLVELSGGLQSEAQRRLQAHVLDFRRLSMSVLQRENYRMGMIGTSLPARVRRPLRSSRERLDRHAKSLNRGAKRRIESEQSRWERAARRFCVGVPTRIRLGRLWLEERSRRLTRAALQRIGREQRTLEVRKESLSRDKLQRLLSRAEERLEAQRKRWQSLDPKNVLARGFSWLRNEKGETIRRTSEVDSGERITATLLEGALDLEVRAKHPPRSEGQDDFDRPLDSPPKPDSE